MGLTCNWSSSKTRTVLKLRKAESTKYLLLLVEEISSPSRQKFCTQSSGKFVLHQYTAKYVHHFWLYRAIKFNWTKFQGRVFARENHKLNAAEWNKVWAVMFWASVISQDVWRHSFKPRVRNFGTFEISLGRTSSKVSFFVVFVVRLLGSTKFNLGLFVSRGSYHCLDWTGLLSER